MRDNSMRARRLCSAGGPSIARDSVLAWIAALAFLCLPCLAHGQSATARNSAPKASVAEAGGGLSFTDVAERAGVTHHNPTDVERRYVIDTMSGGGIALFDCDQDGRLDLVVVNDSTIDKYRGGGEPMVTLYRQDGTGDSLHFTDITQAAGLTVKGWGMGVVVGDYDNDGLPDIYVTGFGHNALYRNRGNCRFEDVTQKAGVAGGGFSTGAAWGDYNRDGLLDLYVARYVTTDPDHLPVGRPPVYKGVLLELPDPMPGTTNLLYRNKGDGQFEEVAAQAGVDNTEHQHGMGISWGDYDGDGWPDLYVTNDGSYSYLFHNLQNGKFEEVGIVSGTAVGFDGQIYGNMAGDFGDYDRDGKLDLFVTRFAAQPASLYKNLDGGSFIDNAKSAGIALPTAPWVKWGEGFGDFDNDGWLDLLMVSGNFSTLLNGVPGEPNFEEPIELFRNLGNSTFTEVANASGLNKGPSHSRRGTAIGDLRNSGNLDIVVYNVDAPPSIFLNTTKNANHKIMVKLVGTKSNRMAVGARVEITSASGLQVSEVHAGGSYLSCSDPRLHFGLGADKTIDQMAVKWPSGATQSFMHVEGDRFYELTEGGELKVLKIFQ